MAVSDIGTLPFYSLAAQHAFWKVEKSVLQELAKLKKVDLPRAASVYQVVCALIKAFLPGATDEICMQYAKHRIAAGEKQDTWNDEISCCDEAQAVLEKSDAQALKTEKKQAALETEEHKEFSKEFTKAKKAAAELRSKLNSKTEQKKKSDLKKGYTSLPVLPHSEIDVIEARKMTPPRSLLGRDDKKGYWQGFYEPYPSKARAWRKWGERESLNIVLRHLWVKYLVDEGWDTNMCPIDGLFKSGETLEDFI